MPVVIGAKPESSFADPIALLTDCHRRIERFLDVLVRVDADARGCALTPEQRAALEKALRYFREAAPKHTADEDETLFPRLRRHSGPEAEPLLACVESLEREHARADSGHAEIDRLGQAWLASGSLPPAHAERFSTVVAELADLYRDHIASEERDLFPAAAKLLTPSDREEIGSEMAARRSVTAPPSSAGSA